MAKWSILLLKVIQWQVIRLSTPPMHCPKFTATAIAIRRGLTSTLSQANCGSARWVPRGGDEINLISLARTMAGPPSPTVLSITATPLVTALPKKKGWSNRFIIGDPVQSPSGIAFYSSNVIPEWENNLFVGGLSSRHIARLVFKEGKVVGEERLLEEEGQRIRDVADGKDGSLYAVTDEGRLYRIAKK